MKLSMLSTLLWLLQPALKAAIVAVMYRRKLHLRFPLFFSLLAYGIMKTALLWSLHASYRAYFYAYWATDAVELLLMLGVVYELFTAMFRQHHALRDFGTMLFRWAAVMAGLTAVLLLFTGLNPSTATFVKLVMNVDRSVSVMQCGLLLFVILFAPYLKISFRHQIFGIAAALGVYAASVMILNTQWLHQVAGFVPYSNSVKMLLYNLTLLTWLIYSLLPLPAESAPNMLLRPQRWNEALLDATQASRGPVMLGIEDIVDRTMSTRTKPVHIQHLS